MKSKISVASSVVALFCAGCACSGPKATGGPAKPAVVALRHKAADRGDMVEDMVEAARLEYEEGRLESAGKILRAALDEEPKNLKAHYYMTLVQEAMQAAARGQDRAGSWHVTPWFPTIPPRPVH